MNNESVGKNRYLLIAIILILGIGAGFLGYLKYKNNTAFAPVAPISTTPTPPPEVWEKYTNSQLGFSIEYPQMAYGVYRCSPDKDIWVPVKVFEDNAAGITYITQEYYYSEQNNNNNIQDNADICKKNTYALEMLKNEEKNATFPDGTHYSGWKPLVGWKILTNSIKNDTELNKFIKDKYGPGCFVEKKEIWKQQAGVYEIELKGEDWDRGMDLGSSTCVINYKYKVLYAPEKNKAMSIKLGQECTFDISPTDSIDYQCNDYKMIDSFKFE